MPRREFIDGVTRDHVTQLGLVYRGPAFVVDDLVLLRCEVPRSGGNKQVAVYTPERQRLLLEREALNPRAREVSDPERIGTRRFEISEVEGKTQIYIGERYVVSFVEKIPSGVVVELASTERMGISRYFDNEVLEPRGFLASVRAGAVRQYG